MKWLVGLIIVGFIALVPPAALAQRPPRILATPPSLGPRCDPGVNFPFFQDLVQYSDIIAMGHIEASQAGLFKFHVDEYLQGGGEFSALNVRGHNPDEYGQLCAADMDKDNLLVSERMFFNPSAFHLNPFTKRPPNYLMAFTIINDNHVLVNAIAPIQIDQTVIINDHGSARSFTQDQFRQEIQRLNPKPRTINSIMVIGLSVIAISSGIAALIGWRRQQTLSARMDRR